MPRSLMKRSFWEPLLIQALPPSVWRKNSPTNNLDALSAKGQEDK